MGIRACQRLRRYDGSGGLCANLSPAEHLKGMEERHLKTGGGAREIYRRTPLEQLSLPGGPVPVFSTRDRYVENYERISADHIAHMQVTGLNPFIPERLWAASERVTSDLLRRYGARGARVLDVGCGLGRLLAPFSEFRRYGMDISRAYLEHAQRSGIEVCLARVEDMPYTDGLFDLVVCTDVLEHVFDLQTACNQLLRVTRDGGHVVVRVPYREDLSSYVSPTLPYEYVHLRNFDEYGLTLLFERVFQCQVMEMVNGPTLLPWAVPKCRLPVRGIGFALRTLARAARLLGKSAQRAFLAWAFDPFDINVVIRVEGIDRHQVGQFAADLRELRPPEPYKGKGIRYLGEHVRRKVGKAAAGASSGG